VEFNGLLGVLAVGNLRQKVAEKWGDPEDGSCLFICSLALTGFKPRRSPQGAERSTLAIFFGKCMHEQGGEVGWLTA
jgi:hypothetical protein